MIVDISHCPLKDDVHLAFVQDQHDIKLSLVCFSTAFSPHLLQGMMSVPIGVIPKPHSQKLWLIIDPLTREYSPNTCIPCSSVSIPLDNLHHLGTQLINVWKCLSSSVHLSVFTSDVSGAYQQLPMYFLWQLFQVVTIDGLIHVDHNINFGNRGAGGLWGSFMGLVLWVAIHTKHLDDLLAYVHNVFSYKLEPNMPWYAPYYRSLPTKQTWLLELWDKLGVPHDELKQVYGSTLTIIRFKADPNAMIITMPLQSHTDLVDMLCTFTSPGRCCSLCDFQRLAGWMNWALNAYPLLHPSLSCLYAKMSGKSQPHQLIWISISLC